MASCVPAIWSWVTIDTGRPVAASNSAMPTPTGPPIGSNTTARPSGSRCSAAEFTRPIRSAASSTRAPAAMR